MADYSIWILEFARAVSPLGILLHGQTGEREIPYCLTLLRSEDRTVLVDSGFQDEGMGHQLAELDGVTVWRDPVEILADLEVSPHDVDAILVTHAHFDHLGGVDRFPNARVYLQRREFERWQWALALPRRMDWLKQGVSPDDITRLHTLLQDGRLQLLNGTGEDVLPGITLEPDLDTHTYGHQHVVIRNDSSGVWVVPGDVIYLYANLDGIDGDGRYVPIGLAMGSQENCMMSMDRIMAVTDQQSERVLPGHEKLLWERFPSIVSGGGLHIAEVCLRPGDRSRLPGFALKESR